MIIADVLPYVHQSLHLSYFLYLATCLFYSFMLYAWTLSPALYVDNYIFKMLILEREEMGERDDYR